MKFLVYIEARNGALNASSLGVVKRAASLGEVDAVILGAGAWDLAGQAAAQGAVYVAVSEAPELELPLPQSHIDALEALCLSRSYDAVFFASTILSADIAGGLAARLEAGVNWDLTEVELRGEKLVGIRLALSDSVLVETGWTTPTRLASFRPGAFEPEANVPPVASPEIIEIEVSVSATAMLTCRVSAVDGKTGASTSLTNASVIVAGGRGLGSKENLGLVQDLAEALDGSPAVSMPLVSEGWAPYAMQVGQTGSVVRPRLYIACGISGQMQHRVGMDRSGTIVAINTDESAPILRFCDLAVIADVSEVLPKFAALVRERAKESAG